MTFFARVLQLFGALFLLLGLLAAARPVWEDWFGPQGVNGADREGLAGVIDAAAGFVDSLSAAPTWLALVVVGVGLIAFGSWLERRPPGQRS
jgi:hypothetical protein